MEVLWTRQTSDQFEGRKAALKSAYLANSGGLFITVELSSSVGTGFGASSYAANDGYRQDTSDSYASQLAKGEKSLGYFVIEDVKVGGVLHPLHR